MKNIMSFIVIVLIVLTITGIGMQLYVPDKLSEYITNVESYFNNIGSNNNESNDSSSSSDNTTSESTYCTFVNNSNSILYLIISDDGTGQIGLNTITSKSTTKITLDEDAYYYLACPLVYYGAYTIDNGSSITTFNLTDEHLLNSDIYYDSDTPYQFDNSKTYTIEKIVLGTYSIAYEGTNCTIIGDTTISTGETVILTVVAYGGYDLSSSVCTVTGCGYSFDTSTGLLILSNPTADVSVSIVLSKDIVAI